MVELLDLDVEAQYPQQIDEYFTSSVDPRSPLEPDDFLVLKNALMGYALHNTGSERSRAESLCVRFVLQERKGRGA